VNSTVSYPYVAILFSVHHVLKAEKLLLAQGVAHDVVPVPREISSDCGMAIAFAADGLETAGAILRRAHIDIARVFRREADGSFSQLHWTEE
jgi:hypothetical protein